MAMEVYTDAPKYSPAWFEQYNKQWRELSIYADSPSETDHEEVAAAAEEVQTDVTSFEDAAPKSPTGTGFSLYEATRLGFQDWRNQNTIPDNYEENYQRVQEEGASGAQYDPIDITGSNMVDIILSDPKRRQQARRDLVFERMRMQSSDFGISQMLDRFNDWSKRGFSDDQTLTPELANEYARFLGTDVKFDKPVSEFSVQQAVETKQKADQLDENLALLNATGAYTFLQNANYFGTALLGSVGPMELAGSVALGWAAPQIAMSGLTKGASVVHNMLKAKRIADASTGIRTAKTAGMIMEGAAAAEGSAARTAVSTILKNSEAGVKAAKAQRAYAKAEATFEKLSKATLADRTMGEQVGLDGLSFLLGDVPWIQAARHNSEQLGFDLYSEQDKALDTLMAATLGIALPGGLRGLGHALGITPHALGQRRLRELEIDTNAKEATGEITSQEAAEVREAINTVRKLQDEAGDLYRKQSNFLTEQAEEIAKTPTSNETMVSQLSYVINEMNRGNIPKLSNMPQFEAILTNIDSQVLKRVLTEPFAEVFRNNIFREVSDFGLDKVKIYGDTGLLGDRAVTGLTNAESMQMLERLYKGTVLHDSTAFTEFRQWAERFSNFQQSLDSIYARVREQFEANKAARDAGNPPVYTANQLVNVRQEMMNSYLDYRFGNRVDEAQEAIMREGLDDTYTMDPEIAQALNDFETWYSRFVQEKEGKGNITLFDLLSEEGDMDYGATFSKYLDELKEAADSNSHLANIDLYMQDWNREKVNKILEEAYKFDVSSDTDLSRLFGSPRQTYEDLQRVTGDGNMWRARVLERSVSYNNIINNTDPDAPVNLLRRTSVADPSLGNDFTNSIKVVDTIHASRDQGFQDLKRTIVNNLRSNDGMKKRITEALSTSDTTKLRGVDMMFRDAVTKTLRTLPTYSFISPRSVSTMVNTSLRNFRELINRNPEILEAFLNPEDIIARSEIPEFGASSRVLEKSAQVSVNIDTLLDPIIQGLDAEYSRIELQSMHNVELCVNALETMMTVPEYAAEVLTGAATQTVIQFTGSKRNVEYLTKTAGLYYNDLSNTLARMDSQTVKGQTLLQYKNDPANRDAINEAFIRMKHGETGTGNSDAERIAKAIMDLEASFIGSFRKYGSNYTAPSTIVKRQKLQYADAMIKEDEVDAFYDNVSHSLNMEAEDILDFIPPDPAEGTIRRGDRMVEYDEDLVKEVNSAIKEMQSNVQKIAGLGNEVYNKIALWAFRDFDLDAMFDKNLRARISLNATRDALLSGDQIQIKNLIGDDVQNIFDIASSVRQITRSLVGDNIKVVDGRGLIDPLSWVYRFRTGFDDLTAVMTGIKSASIDALDSSIHFKDASSEIGAARLFGYDSVDEHIQSHFNTMFQAYYSLEMFGTKPIGLADAVIDTYNNALTGNEKFAKFIQTLQLKRKGKPRQLEKFAITTSAKDSVHENILLACGLQNESPSTASRWVKAVASFLSVGLLMKAGLRSFSDYATIWENMITNGMVQGRTEAMALSGWATKELMHNRDLLNLVVGAAVVSSEDLAKKMANDPGFDLTKVSKDAPFIDKFENASRRWGHTVMNKMAFMGAVTNNNKMVAAVGIQRAIAKNSHLAWKDLSPDLQKALIRESVMEDDWNFIRTHCVHDMGTYIKNKYGTDAPEGQYSLLIPLSAKDIPDEVIEQELRRRGELNITPYRIIDFRNRLLSQVWNMVDSSADEMVSIPSNRIGNILRTGRARGSGWGVGAEVLTQFQSFGVAMLYSTYGRRLANFAAGETGVSLIDLFNPAVKLNNVHRAKIYTNLLGMLLSISMTMLVIDSAVNALSGNIQKVRTEDGKWHFDPFLRAGLGALGVGGTILDTALTGLETAGQKGGGFAIQAAPSFSNILRIGYRLGRPIFSDNVLPEDKPKAMLASGVQEVARFVGLKTLPIVSLVYQGLVGGWLDSMARGGAGPYDTYQDARERRGMVLMPWERDPRPLWERLQGNY